MSDMTVKQLLAERAKLQAEIGRLIGEFEELSDAIVANVGVNHSDISTMSSGSVRPMLTRVVVALMLPEG